MSERVDLYEGKYFYDLPPEPKDEKQILGFDLKKKDQIWCRPEFPSEFDWRRLTKTEQYEIVDRERDRWHNGVWFFNNGVPTFITGMHYDHLVNATFDFGKCSFFDSHKKDFYFRDLVKKDPKSYGQCTIKPRRYGYSLQEITQQTCEAIGVYSRNLGMMSNNLAKTYETLFQPLVESYMRRPKWVRPDIYMPNNKIPKAKLYWNSGKVSESDGFLFNTSGTLNSRLTPKPTTVMGYDGNKLHYLTLDEAWKWTSTNPYDCWKKQKPTLRVGTEIVGKCSVLSTMGDDDDYAEAILAGIKMFLDSDPNARDANGQTNTGLYHRFISGEYALFDFADPYGFINLDQAQNYILNERKKFAEGSTDWVYEVRRYPLTLDEAISTATGISIFDKKRLDKKVMIITKEGPKTIIGDLYEDPNKKVIFEPTNNGVWEFDKLPKVTKEKDYSNRWFKDEFEGQLHLAKNPQGMIGYDPIRYGLVDTVSQKLSMAAATAYQKFDYYGNGGANKFAGLYHERPDDPSIAHYEVFKAAKLLGFQIAVERQVEAFLQYARDNKFVSFLVHSSYDGKLGFWTTPKTLKDAADLLQVEWKKPKTSDDIDRIMECEIERLLSQGAQLKDLKKMTPFDIMMSAFQALLGAKDLRETLISDDYQKNINSILNLIQPIRKS